MESITIKVEDNLLKRMNKNMKNNGYSTKTEFIREAIRKKIEEDEREWAIREFLKLRGKAKVRTRPEDDEKIREEVGKELQAELEKRFNLA